MELTNPEQDFNVGNGSLGEGPHLENDGSQVDKVGDEDEASSQVVPKRQRAQKTSTRDAVQAARGEGEVVVGAETADKTWSEKGKHQVTAKDEFAGAGDIKDWVDKLTSSKSLHTLLSQRSLSANSRPPRSTSGTSAGSALKVPCSTPVSSGASQASHVSRASRASLITHPPSPDDLPAWSQPRDFYFNGPYIDGSDEVECNTALKLFKQDIRWTDTMDVTEVVSDSDVDEWVSPPPPVITQPSVKKGGASGKTARAVSDGKKRTQQNETDTWESGSGAPPSKRSKTSQHSTSASQRTGSGVNNKYVKGDLPPGSTVDNIWRRVFISALAHFAATYDNPWTIPSERFTSVLQVIWDTVYNGKIEHTVTIGRPVFHIARQSLNNWRGGFAAASMAVITTFFANDVDFEDSEQRVDFAKAMLKRNRFLFSQNRGTDNKTWSGLWRAPFVLQTFAHHFNFIQGRMEVPDLSGKLTGVAKFIAPIIMNALECRCELVSLIGIKSHYHGCKFFGTGPRTALALACAAVCRTLTLVAENHITFKSSSSTGMWTAVIPKGNQYEFNDTIWGAATRRYLEPIKGLSEENFSLVVDDTQKYMKKGTATSSAVDLGEDSEYEDLFAFC
ncbi:hypothetical protein EDD15DRAFT_2190587 [Pisolithus albus]|nr:hypothetical protein EDD15DRAFT_2190587 [Pisolithus albus]